MGFKPEALAKDGTKCSLCQAAPWGEMVAINVNAGEYAWCVPLGVVEELEAKGINKDRHHEHGRFRFADDVSELGWRALPWSLVFEEIYIGDQHASHNFHGTIYPS